MSSAKVSIQDWVDYVFDHPVTEAAWHWADDAPYLEVEAAREAELIAETFESSEKLLAGFTDAQLKQGLWYLVDSSCSNHMLALLATEVPEPLRLRALRSFVPLFETTLARRCTPHLSHLDERGAGALNAACYMWWDLLSFVASPDEPSRRAFDREVLSAMRRILEIPHDACRESALHGLGHWQDEYPGEVAAIIDRFLHSARGLRGELRRYAEGARRGCVQ